MQPGQSSCLAKTAEIKAGEWPWSSTPPPLGSALAPQLPRLQPPSTATPPLPRLRWPSRALPYRSPLISFHTITLSSTNASRTLLLLLSCPLRWFVNFLAPGIQCSRGCRGSTVCWARRAGAIQPLPGTGKKKTHKVRKDPTNHLSQQCTPVFVH